MIFSPELTFLPSTPPYEFLTLKEGEKVVKKLNEKLVKHFRKTGVLVQAKVDPFHNAFQKDSTFCIEIVPWGTSYWESGWFSKTAAGSSYGLFKKGVEGIFRLCRQAGLVPTVSEYRRNKEIHFPDGGMHIHVCNNMFWQSSVYYKRMERFHRNLVVDYANRPYIRWLFSQWLDNRNSNVIFDLEQLKELRRIPTEEEIFNASFINKNAIEPRFMGCSKSSYNTFEFRFIGMTNSYEEIRAVVSAIEKWMAQIELFTIEKKTLVPEISAKSFNHFHDLKEAKQLCKKWIDNLGLKWDTTFETFWKRNYRNRILYGQLL